MKLFEITYSPLTDRLIFTCFGMHFKINLHYAKRMWRHKNKHNQTSLGIPTDISCVTVGKGSYGTINVQNSSQMLNTLKIGHYCSVGQNVVFLLGVEHDYKHLSTYPFKVKFCGELSEAFSKGDIVVEDDVWIGYNATILGGVKLGKGCIVGASSVVTKDVPPYAIVAGNPARILKYRFEPQIVEKLMEIDFSMMNRNNIDNIIEILYTKLTLDNYCEIIEKVKKVIENEC
mgnify:FL=1